MSQEEKIKKAAVEFSTDTKTICNSLVEQGFTPDQAFQLLLVMLTSSSSSNNKKLVTPV